MNSFKLKNQKGASLLEYGLLVGLIAVAAIGAVLSLGTKIDRVFTSANTALAVVPAGAAPTVPALSDLAYMNVANNNSACQYDANCAIFYTDDPAERTLGQNGVPNVVTLAVRQATSGPPGSIFYAGTNDSMLISEQTDDSFAAYLGGPGNDTLVVTSNPSSQVSVDYDATNNMIYLYTTLFTVGIDPNVEYVYFTQDDLRFTFQDMMDAYNPYGGAVASLPAGTGQHMQTGSGSVQ